MSNWQSVVFLCESNGETKDYDDFTKNKEDKESLMITGKFVVCEVIYFLFISIIQDIVGDSG